VVVVVAMAVEAMATHLEVVVDNLGGRLPPHHAQYWSANIVD